MDIITPLTDFRAHLPTYLGKLRKKRRQRVIVTRNGRPAAILMSPEEVETLEVMADRNLLLSLIRAEKEVKEGQFVRHDELFH